MNINLNKIFLPRPEDIQEQWIVIDGAGQIVGRLATKIASIMRGKNTVITTPHVKTGTRVILINAEKVVFTGNKQEEKEYWEYTGWRGNKKEFTSKDLFKKNPEKIMYRAVKGMLRNCKLDSQLLESHLKIYKGENHPHKAQVQ
jgi:large subunit ribosomal protein L13